MPETAPATDSAAELLGAHPERFARALATGRAGAHVVSSGSARPAGPILFRDAGGAIAPGAFAGALTIDEDELRLEPRIGWPALIGWVESAADLSAGLLPGDDGLGTCAGLIWVRAVDGASRHGPPAFRRDVEHVGAGVRGRLDVRRTVQMRARGSTGAASVYRARDLDNAVTRIIVAADRVLARRLGHGRWRTDRVEDILPQLRSAVGRRAPVSGDAELDRIRYAPITRAYKSAAELSARIVRQDPVATTPLPGRVQGLVLDLQSVWAEALLAWAREARPDLRASLDSSQVLVEDTERARCSLAVVGTGPTGAPVIRASVAGAGRSEIQLPADARAAAGCVADTLAAA